MNSKYSAYEDSGRTSDAELFDISELQTSLSDGVGYKNSVTVVDKHDLFHEDDKTSVANNGGFERLVSSSKRGSPFLDARTNSQARSLDCHIEATVYRMTMKTEDSNRCGCLKNNQFFKSIDIRAVTSCILSMFILLGYTAYLGYAIYSNPSESVFVCILGVIIAFICINKISKGKLRLRLVKCCSKLELRITPRNKRVNVWLRRLSTLVVLVSIAAFLVMDLWDKCHKWIPLGGLVVFVGLSALFSKYPRKILWMPVIWGIYVQFGLGLLILRWRPGFEACQWVGLQVTTFLGYTDVGSKFVFGEKYLDHPIVFKILPTLVFFSAFISVLYYIGVMQIVIKSIAILLQVCLGTTPIESFATAAHIFLGPVETSVALRPFWNKLTESEIHAVMTSGFATVAGAIIAAYVEFGIPAEHVISASFMSAPAALAIAKISIPETEVSQIRTQRAIKLPAGQESNLIEALSVGATTAIKLVAYVVVNLIAFIAVLNFLDTALTYFGARINCPGLSFQLICSYLFMPLAAIIGVPWGSTKVVAALVGKKIVINEFLAYVDLGAMIQQNTIDERSAVLATYILCGFGSIAALGINLGGVSSAAPDRRSDFARLSLRSMINGNIACFMTACIAGLLYQSVPLTEQLTDSFNSTFVYLNTTGGILNTTEPIMNSIYV